MNVWTVINNVIVLLGLIPCIGLSIHLGATMAQRLPAQQRNALEQFARQAVKQIEQQYAKNPGKKDLARASVATLFNTHRLPIPAAQAIDIAIEAAVQELPKPNNPPAQ